MDALKGLVFITLDCARYDRMSFNGYTGVKHENMEWFADHGKVYSNCISQAVTTPPSHASMLTGKYPFEHGLRRMYGSKLRPDVKTIPEMLLEQGWTTACATGFEGLATAYGLDRGFEQVDENSNLSMSWGKNANGHAKGNDWRLWMCKMQYDESKPLFIWLHYFFGHTGSDKVLPSDYKGIGRKGEYDNGFFDNYDGKFLWFDREWLPMIKSKFPVEDFAYVITSDHGDDFGKHEIAHGSHLFHDTIHVPAIVRVPNIDEGIVAHHLTESRELIQDTLYYDMGIDFPHEKKYDCPKVSYSETLCDYAGNRDKTFRYCFMCESSKAIFMNEEIIGKGKLEGMYCVGEDPEEEKNLVSFAKGDTLMQARLADLQDDYDIEAPICTGADDIEVEKRLKDLGYM